MKKVIVSQEINRFIRKEKSFLNRADIRIFEAESNSSAISLHKSERADLIIAELDSSGMSGEALCSIIRGDSAMRKVSIIIVCSGSESDMKRCIDCNANVFISHPVNSAVLLQEAHRLLNIAGRKSYRIPVSVKIEGMSKNESFKGNLENISSSGMLFRSSAVLAEGDNITCSFNLPDKAKISACAEIVRAYKENQGTDNIYGVSFTDIGVDFASAIENFVASSGATYPRAEKIKRKSGLAISRKGP